MVSDASGFSGCEPGHYSCMGGREFVIEPSGRMHLADSELLSGAWFQLDRNVEFLISRGGLSFHAAWDLCSRSPPALAGIELPELQPGAEASFILAHWDDGLVLDQSAHQGQPYLSEPWHPTDLKQPEKLIHGRIYIHYCGAVSLINVTYRLNTIWAKGVHRVTKLRFCEAIFAFSRPQS
ncbi:MAG: hypothetical protein ACLFWL_09215 [Candidatus Brocadiia bacterium]